jgi:hypothetical protein
MKRSTLSTAGPNRFIVFLFRQRFMTLIVNVLNKHVNYLMYSEVLCSETATCSHNHNRTLHLYLVLIICYLCFMLKQR